MVVVKRSRRGQTSGQRNTTAKRSGRVDRPRRDEALFTTFHHRPGDCMLLLLLLFGRCDNVGARLRFLGCGHPHAHHGLGSLGWLDCRRFGGSGCLGSLWFSGTGCWSSRNDTTTSVAAGLCRLDRLVVVAVRSSSWIAGRRQESPKSTPTTTTVGLARTTPLVQDAQLEMAPPRRWIVGGRSHDRLSLPSDAAQTHAPRCMMTFRRQRWQYGPQLGTALNVLRDAAVRQFQQHVSGVQGRARHGHDAFQIAALLATTAAATAGVCRIGDSGEGKLGVVEQRRASILVVVVVRHSSILLIQAHNGHLVEKFLPAADAKIPSNAQASLGMDHVVKGGSVGARLLRGSVFVLQIPDAQLLVVRFGESLQLLLLLIICSGRQGVAKGQQFDGIPVGGGIVQAFPLGGGAGVGRRGRREGPNVNVFDGFSRQQEILFARAQPGARPKAAQFGVGVAVHRDQVQQVLLLFFGLVSG